MNWLLLPVQGSPLSILWPVLRVCSNPATVRDRCTAAGTRSTALDNGMNGLGHCSLLVFVPVGNATHGQGSTASHLACHQTAISLLVREARTGSKLAFDRSRMDHFKEAKRRMQMHMHVRNERIETETALTMRADAVR